VKVLVASVLKTESDSSVRIAPADKSRPKRLDSLTSLRFFAAAGVIYAHCDGVFSVCSGLEKIEWSHLLSWFFILSGFILTYMYPKLDSWGHTVKFFRARIARVYPAHVFALAVPFVLALTPQFTFPELAKLLSVNLLMVHAWIPQSYYFFSLNPPAWSVSTEFFFYLMFPLLIANISRTWPAKLLGTFLLVTACVLASAYFNLPDKGGPLDVTTFAVLYINPLTRLFEFVLGMSSAILWKRLHEHNIRAPIAFAGELIFLTLAGIYMFNCNNWLVPLTDHSALLRCIRIWLLYNGNCFCFAGLIICFALQTGYLSRFLSNRFWVGLGELSYSMYLLHIFGRNYFVKFQSQLGVLNDWLCLAVYFVILMAASHLLAEYVEIPIRALIAGTKKTVKTSSSQDLQQPKKRLQWKPVLALCEVAVLAITFVGIKYQIKTQNKLHSQRLHL
jgi:peptidoglycan/LPS O-acetylase OafA/YrhL